MENKRFEEIDNFVTKMMERDIKYYTPSIEEFHVGFEYEAKPNDPLEWDKALVKTFPETPHNLGGRFLFEFIEDRLSINCIRVKYLDKEDIESLGFVQNKKFPYLFENEMLGCRLVESNKHHQYTIKSNRFDDECFRGVIQNKSELKKLLPKLTLI